MPEFNTRYVGHDTVYQKRLADGAIGWDGSAEEYDERYKVLEPIISGGHMPASGRLLELGCGAGNMGIWWAHKGYAVRGIDIAPTAVELANKRAQESGLEVEFFCGNVVDLEPFADDSFDLIYDSHLVHCIIGDDRPTLYRNILRVMKPGAYFLLSTMVYTEMTLELQGFDPESYYTIMEFEGETVWTRYIGREEDLLQEVRDAGLEILKTHWHVGTEGHSELLVEARKS